MWIAAAFWMLSAGTAWPIDQVYTSTSESAYFGKITGISAATVSLDSKQKGAPNEIPANEIKRILFENSPDGLHAAQKAMLSGEYEKAIEALKKETPEANRAEVADEIVYCRAYCTAQLALSGAGTADPNEAGRLMYAFVKGSPNSFHYYTACELLGDIFVAKGDFPNAQKYYAMLSQAPWPDYKIRAQVALGRSYLSQGNAASADKAFDDALNNDAPGELAEAQRTAARIGKARCLVLGGKTDQAIRSLDEILNRTEEKQVEVNAMAYNALGTALRKDKPKDAILAFLHVHLANGISPDLDAEAVANLEKLFTETHKPDHSREMREILNEKYRNSRWAKGVK